MKLTLTICVFISAVLFLQAQPTVSFTFDDGITSDMPGYDFEQWNSMILDHLDEAGLKAVFFVTGANKRDAKGQYLLKSWNDRGHKLGNHTFTHINYNRKDVTFAQFKTEFLRTDTVIRSFSNYIRLFRFPYLKAGDTPEKIGQFQEFLKEQHYGNGAVTIDASDWYIASRLIKRLRENSQADVTGFRDFYLEHLYARATYYETLAFELTGRHIHHTVLLHHNLASALFLGDLIKMFKSKGWQVMDAEQAFEDKIFQRHPMNIPAGEGLIWALAKETGKYNEVLRYPAEDNQYEEDRMNKLGL